MRSIIKKGSLENLTLTQHAESKREIRNNEYSRDLEGSERDTLYIER